MVALKKEKPMSSNRNNLLLLKQVDNLRNMEGYCNLVITSVWKTESPLKGWQFNSAIFLFGIV